VSGPAAGPPRGGADPRDPAAPGPHAVADSILLTERLRSEDRRSFHLLGRTWELLPEVFSPALSSGTEFYTRRLPFPRGGRFLEIGCGAGVTSVVAALSGCAAVTAVDIGPPAVANTARNARRHGATALRALVSDVFAAVPDRGYDVVFWNIPYVGMPEGYEHPSDLTRSVFDVGHRCCRAYLAGARSVLAPGGRLFLGFGDIGDRAAMEAIAAGHGWRAELLAAGRSDPDPHIEHRLFELHDIRPPGGGPGSSPGPAPAGP
jgi:SAM-dependent methyltransferase